MTRGPLRAAAVAAAAVASLIVSATAAADPVVPNDPAWPEQWAQVRIRVPELWQFTTGDPRVVIALIDTGADRSVADVEGGFVPGWDFVENDADPQDTDGHGTQVAAQIAAKGNNNLAVAGYCWQCRIMPVRVMSSGRDAYSDRVADGIRWAVDHGARIVSLSIGSPLDVPNGNQQASAIRYAQERGALVVASGGNLFGQTTLFYPAAYPGVLSVAATKPDDTLDFWSSAGQWITLAAPGCNSTTPGGTVWGTLCGTSVTAPVVAGVAGLLLSLNPSLTAAQLSWALRSTATPIPGIGGGRIDAYSAAAALGLVPPTPPVSRPSKPVVVRYSSQSRVVFGALAKKRRFTVNLGQGRFRVNLRARVSGRWTVSFRGGGEILTTSGTRHVDLGARLKSGRYTVELRYAGRSVPRFALTMTGRFRVPAAVSR